MAKNRISLQNELERILGSRNVYYNPPETQKIEIPGIIYNLSYIENINADNIKYLDYTTYKITVVSRKVDHPAIKGILNLPMTKFSANFTKDGLYHTVIILNQKEKQ